MQDQEIEIKYYIHNLPRLQENIEKLGAVLLHPRVFEENLRFDLPDGSLTAAHRVLRLRRDSQNRMTYKGPALPGQAASIRQEIEFSLEDFDAAHRLLEALGYRVSIRYEKFRTEFRVKGLVVALDKMPYGNFIEIEGDQPAEMRRLSARLGLNWERRCLESYLAIFQRLRQKLNLQVEHLTFDGFSGITISAEDLDLLPADL